MQIQSLVGGCIRPWLQVPAAAAPRKKWGLSRFCGAGRLACRLDGRLAGPGMAGSRQQELLSSAPDPTCRRPPHLHKSCTARLLGVQGGGGGRGLEGRNQ